MIGLNLKGVLNCTRAVINHMIEKRSGKIVNTASVDGTIGGAGRADYAAAKAAVIVFTISVAKEVAPYGINVNCVSPGPIASGLLGQKLSEHTEESSRWVEGMKEKAGLGRLGKPEDIATLAVFLASHEANFITRQNYAVCGPSNLNFGW